MKGTFSLHSSANLRVFLIHKQGLLLRSGPFGYQANVMLSQLKASDAKHEGLLDLHLHHDHPCGRKQTSERAEGSKMMDRNHLEDLEDSRIVLNCVELSRVFL